jgi:hypothetical protein
VKLNLRRKCVLKNMTRKNSDMIRLIAVGDSEELDLSTTRNTRWRTRDVVQLHRKTLNILGSAAVGAVRYGCVRSGTTT